MAVDWLLRGGKLLLTAGFLLPMGALGVWMLAGAFRRGLYVDLTTPQGLRRMRFRADVPVADARAFAAELGKA